MCNVQMKQAHSRTLLDISLCVCVCEDAIHTIISIAYGSAAVAAV